MKDVYKEYDLGKLGLLPNGWLEQITAVCNTHTMRTLLDGRSVTSREPEGIEPIEVHVVTGSIVKDKLSWLDDLYNGKLLEFASQFMSTQVVASRDLESGVNINVLRGKGSRYEWHVDSNPVTGLLFVTSHPQGSGGELVFKTQTNLIKVYPTSGVFITFDAREIPHTVMPLISSDVRISIPMNFYLADQDQERPDDLTDYLYTEST